MKLTTLKDIVSEPIGCGRCGETPVFMSVLDTGEYFSLFAACPSCHFNCGMKVDKHAPNVEVIKAVDTVRRCFRACDD